VFWPVWSPAGSVAALGDWVSYWFGFNTRNGSADVAAGRVTRRSAAREAFVKTWACPAFHRRDFSDRCGPRCRFCRIFEMPYWSFQLAKLGVGAGLVGALLRFGDVIAQIAEWLWRTV